MTAELTELYEIITPLATTNLGDNPSLEVDTNRWSAVGTAAAIARDNTQARFGRWSLKITSGTDVLSGGYYYTAGSGISVSSSTAYAFSAYVYNPTRAIRISVRDQAGTELAVQTAIAASSKWKRIEIAFTTGGSSTTVHIRFTNNNDGTTHDFYVDAAQVELQSNPTTYCDGDQPGCSWDGIEHGSTSQREAFGPGGLSQVFDDLGIRVELMTGASMPPLSVNRQSLSRIPGSVFEDVKVLERPANLVLSASGSSLTNLHKLKRDLFDTIKPDRVQGDHPFRLVYKGTDEQVHADFVFEDGFGGGQREGFYERMAGRLIAPDPFWYEDRQEAALPGFTQNVSKDRVLRRHEGVWGFPTSGANGNVLAIARAPNGAMYFGGAFTSFAGVSNTERAAKLINDAIQALDGGFDDGEVRAIAIAPDGTVYLGGTFTTANATALTLNRIAKYDPSTDSLSAMGTTPGVNGAVNALAIGLDGTLYLAGEFTDEGTRIAEWTGSAFNDPFGTGSASPIRALAVSPDGDLFVGGDFTSINAVTANRIAKWNGTVFTAVGGNGQLNAECRALAFGPDGKLYAGGDFTTASGNTVNRIAVWGGSDWLALQSGVDDDVHSLAWIGDLLWLGGIFGNTASTPALEFPRVGIWNGSAFVRADLALPSTPTVSAIAGDREDVYLGHSTTGNAVVGVKTTVSNNGSAAAYPIIVFTGPGTLKWIENRSDRRRLYFDLEAQAGEEIEINLSPFDKSISSSWRVAALQPLAGSDMATFRLLSGANEIIAYATGTTGATEVHFRWPIVHWSRDAGSE
jgi:hypothetical protein